MFKNKRELKSIEEERKKLEKQRNEIEIQKEELLLIKKMLDESSTKIDVTDVYILTLNNVKYFVRLYSSKIKAYSPFLKRDITANDVQLIDIFSKKCLIEKTSIDSIEEIIGNMNLLKIQEYDKELLIYVDKLVPDYILQQMYYKINNLVLSNESIIRK